MEPTASDQSVFITPKLHERYVLSKLEQTDRQVTIEADCTCFPPEEPPRPWNWSRRSRLRRLFAVRCMTNAF